MSVKYRRVLLNLSWSMTCAMTVGTQVVLALGYIVIGRNASIEEVRLFAYLLASAAAVAALAWVVLVPFWYAHYQSTLRQADPVNRPGNSGDSVT